MSFVGIAQTGLLRHDAEMKAILAGLLLIGLVLPASALDKTELDFRIRNLMLKLETLQSKPDKRIPAESLRKAKGIVLLDQTKAGFMFAYQGGSGVVMAKDPKTGRWSPPAFMKSSEASLGFQVGGQQSFVVILLMRTNILDELSSGSYKFSGEASGTAGENSSGVEGNISGPEPHVLVYTDKEGLYGGAALKGASLKIDTKADVTYYGQAVTPKEILVDHKVEPSSPAVDLARKLEGFAK